MIRKEAAPKAASLFLIQWWLFADPTGRCMIVWCYWKAYHYLPPTEVRYMKVGCDDESVVLPRNHLGEVVG